jgi:hypothetical protein
MSTSKPVFTASFVMCCGQEKSFPEDKVNKFSAFALCSKSPCHLSKSGCNAFLTLTAKSEATLHKVNAYFHFTADTGYRLSSAQDPHASGYTIGAPLPCKI